MDITRITTLAGAHRRRKRVGRGEGSGSGKTSGRGNKGSGQRAGWRARLVSEGGQMPIFRRLPKRGFSNVTFRTEYQVVNLRSLEGRFADGAHLTAADLAAAGLIRHVESPVKILGDGVLTKKLTIEADRFSKEAERKIEAAGGSVKRIGPQPKKKFVRRPPAPAAGKAEGRKGEGADERPAAAERKAAKGGKGRAPRAEPESPAKKERPGGAGSTEEGGA